MGAALAATALLGASRADAQSLLGPDDARRHAVRVEVALDPALIVGLGYSYAAGFGAGRPSLSVGAGVRWPPVLVGNGAVRANALLATRWLTRDGWGAMLTAAPYYVGDSNEAARFDALGLELRLNPGVFRPRWFVALDGGWQSALATHVRHTAQSRAAFDQRYPDGVRGVGGPRDGWFGATAHRFRVGLVAGYAVTPALTLDLALGGTVSVQNQGLLVSFDLAQLPFYLQLGARVAW